MNMFTADYSSSLNSTPARDTPQQRKQLSQASELASTTPIAPPPSTIFGSSQFGTGVSKLRFSKGSTFSPPAPSSFPHGLPRTKNGTPAQPRRRRFHTSFGTSVDDGYPLEDGPRFSDESMEEEEEEAEDGDYENSQPIPSLLKFSTASGKRSTHPPTVSHHRTSGRSAKLSQLPRRGQANVVPGLARDLGERAPPAPLEEADEVILETDQILREMDQQTLDLEDGKELQAMVTAYAHELIVKWRKHGEIQLPALDSNTIGPPPSAPPFAKANYLASLLLALYLPPSSGNRPSSESVPTPQILLDWLDNYHVSYDPMYHAVASTSPNCTSHVLFWDSIQSLTLRGKLHQVMRLLAEADFRYAVTAEEDGGEGGEGGDRPGYHGAQLQSVQSVIYRARQILNECPGIESNDWDVVEADWNLFRAQVQTELDHLTDLAAAHDDEDDDSFQAENFGIRKPGLSLLGKLNQTPKGKIPWTIYQNLKILYSILLGSAEEIIAQSQDWLEAATALTIWWDGAEDAKIAQWSFDVSRATELAQEEDLAAANPYLTRLRDAFLCVTDPGDGNSFQLNAMSPVEVGLGAILQGSIQGILSILRALSQCVASAVAEVGARAGWLAGGVVSAGPPELSEDDLMVLNYGEPERGLGKDDLLLGYADALFDKDFLRSPEGSSIEGWELAISVVTRVDDRRRMHATIGEFLDHLQVVEQDRAEKLINLCSDLGLQDEARKISERFGDHLVHNTTDYGTALLCYARSRASGKIRQLVDLLISYSLVQSSPYPADAALDDGLKTLVGSPRTALADIADVDPEAAEILQFYLVGYASLRRYYNLRDDEVTAAKAGRKPTLRPLARKRAAAKALIAVINSAADSIYGGLYDPERQSAIQVDGLFTLLGEATVFLRPDTRSIFSTSQLYALLAAIEDLQTVNGRVYAATEDCLQAALRNYLGSAPPSPHAMLKKSMSSGTNSNFSFSMMGSEMLASTATTAGRTNESEGSGVLVPSISSSFKGRRGDTLTPKGWDWRAQFRNQGVTTGQDVLQYLRIEIAKELSVAGLDEGAPS